MSGSSSALKPRDKKRAQDDSGAESGWKAVLFNCDCHTFDEVERQLIKAIRCTLSAARRFSMQVHSQGSAPVYHGARERCEAVAAVLEEIGLVARAVQ